MHSGCAGPTTTTSVGSSRPDIRLWFGRSSRLYCMCTAAPRRLTFFHRVCQATVPVRNAMQSLQELGSLFSQSLKCRMSFATIAQSEHGLAKVQQIRLLCPTRCLVHVPAIHALIKQYGPVLDCLEEMSQPSAGSNAAAQASSLRSQLSISVIMVYF